jgi:hypothetical protein
MISSEFTCRLKSAAVYRAEIVAHHCVDIDLNLDDLGVVVDGTYAPLNLRGKLCVPWVDIESASFNPLLVAMDMVVQDIVAHIVT